MTKLELAERIAKTGKVMIPGLSEWQTIFVLSCLNKEELETVEEASANSNNQCERESIPIGDWPGIRGWKV